MKVYRTVLLFDGVHYSYGTVIGLGASKRGMFVRRQVYNGTITYVSNDTYRRWWYLVAYRVPIDTIPLQYDLVKTT